MANATDFVGTVYDTLASLLNIGNMSQDLLFQMAWPGYPLSPADFKCADAPNGPYDPLAAQETFSQVANIVPVLNNLKYDNSGFEVDDLYEILITGAIPGGANQDNLDTNPQNRLFCDAQYELVQARRGSKSDPNIFYYPCIATPSNWYEQGASQFWTSIDISSTNVKSVNTPASPFAKAGGLVLAKPGLWRIKTGLTPENNLKMDILQRVGANSEALRQKLTPHQTNVNTKPLDKNIIMATRTMSGATPDLVSSGFTGTPVFFNNLRNPASGMLVDTGFTRTSTYYENLSAARKRTVFHKKYTPTNIFSDPKFKMEIQDGIINGSSLDIKGNIPTFSRKLLARDLVYQELPNTPVSVTTDGFRIFFRFCQVSINRPWFKLALLSTGNWCMCNTEANEYSNGKADNNPGMFPLLPMSFIVICDLKITANWSQEDKTNLSQAVSFGPFDISNGTLNQNTLEIKGMQIIAWISRLMPALPPLPYINP